MKKLLTAFTIIFICINSSFGQSFKVDTVVFKVSSPVVSATYYEGQIYFLDKQDKIYRVKSPGDYEEIPVSGRSFSYLYTINGELVAFEWLDGYKYDTYRNYHYDGTTFRKKKKVNQGKEEETQIYEDETFTVSAICQGEWGGTAYFKDKRTGKEYECEATCPRIVNKIGSTYFVTATLGHMGGSTEVLQVDNPTRLAKRQKRVSINISEKESRSTKGTKILADSISCIALTSFVYQEELYHILSNDYDLAYNPPSTFLAKTKNGKFELVQKLMNEHLYRKDYSTEIYDQNGFWLALINDTDNGKATLLRVNGNKITLFTFEQ